MNEESERRYRGLLHGKAKSFQLLGITIFGYVLTMVNKEREREMAEGGRNRDLVTCYTQEQHPPISLFFQSSLDCGQYAHNLLKLGK